MFYATYKDIGDTDIAAFETEEERNGWVNFQDPFSKGIGANAENCTFERIELDSGQAEKRITSMLHIIDNYNPKMHWFLGGYLGVCG